MTAEDSPQRQLMIYLDHHATTPTAPEVVAAMLPYFTEVYGNSASAHGFGREASAGVERAGEQVAAAIGATARELIFTSGATESVNLALQGAIRHFGSGSHIVTSRIEHPAARDTCRMLAQAGAAVSEIGVDTDGIISLAELEAALRPDTRLISIMAANNEIGTIQPLAEIGALAKRHGILFHSDASQALGHIPLDVEAMGIDLLSASAHKLYGPKGVGVLFCRRKSPHVRLEPLLWGGGHQRGRRPGTLNVPGIVGFGAACDLAVQRLRTDADRISALRDHLADQLLRRFPGSRVNGAPNSRLPGNLSISLPGIDAVALLGRLPEIAASTGSACATAVPEPSHVLRAIGLSTTMAAGTIRFGLGRQNTYAEMDRVVECLVAAVSEMGSIPADYSSNGCPLL